jgi:hypothetical protein
MAISENRLSERNLVGLVTTDFIGSVDTGEDQPNNTPKESIDVVPEVKSESNKKAQSLGKSNIFTKGIGNTFEESFSNSDVLLASINNLNSSLSNDLCNTTIVNGKVQRLPENRDFWKQSTPNTGCNLADANLSIDSFLQTVS